MAGYVTSSRLHPVYPPLPFESGRPFGVYKYAPKHGVDYWRLSSSGGALIRPVQTTTSYRSGGGELDVGSDEDALPSGSHAEVLRTLSTERHRNKGSSNYDTGHTFDTLKQELYVEPNYGTYEALHVDRDYYKGPALPALLNLPAIPGTSTVYPANPIQSTTWYEVEAIKRTIPTSPHVSLATTLGELMREGLPSLIGSQLRDKKRTMPQKGGSEYLNWQFGYKPLASDLSKLLLSVSEAGLLLEQLQRDSGRIIRRGVSFPEVETVSISAPFSMTLLNPGVEVTTWDRIWDTSGRHATYTQAYRTFRKVYFKGAYSYFLQNDDSRLNGLVRRQREIQHLVGLELDPEVVWNLTPWSWLTDWVANVGSNISNANALSKDGLVIRWAYLMDMTVHERILTPRPGSVFRLKNGGSVPAPELRYVSTRKRRLRATPYGFGLNPSSFTGRQWAILAALGMTKSPQSLHGD